MSFVASIYIQTEFNIAKSFEFNDKNILKKNNDMII